MRSHATVPAMLLGVTLALPAGGQIPVLDLPAAPVPTTSSTLPASPPPEAGAPAEHGGGRRGWPTLPARGKGIETFRQELEASRAALEARRVAGEIGEREYAREMRQYRRLLRAYLQRVR